VKNGANDAEGTVLENSEKARRYARQMANEICRNSGGTQEVTIIVIDEAAKGFEVSGRLDWVVSTEAPSGETCELRIATLNYRKSCRE
jgi:hypothetical protein